jgi:hypothetical protein
MDRTGLPTGSVCGPVKSGRISRIRPETYLEAQTAFAGCIGESLDAAVKDEGAAVENHFLDTGLGGALGNELDVLRRAMNRQARTAVGHRLDLTAHAVGATCKCFFPASHFA